MQSVSVGASVQSVSRNASADGWEITVPTRADALASIAAAVQRGQGFSVCTLNLDHLVKLRRSASFRAAYRAAAFVTADGAPVAWLARRGGANVELATGADLVIPLAVKAAQIGCGVYLFGSTPDVLETAGQVLIKAGDGSLKISGRASPSGQFDPTGPEADAAIEQIKASGAGLCFLARQNRKFLPRVRWPVAPTSGSCRLGLVWIFWRASKCARQWCSGGSVSNGSGVWRKTHSGCSGGISIAR
jgi:UDP-N-acetyl-D-mannosaminuronic acid transferase (WecB/TagA/CpsF family)